MRHIFTAAVGIVFVLGLAHVAAAQTPPAGAPARPSPAASGGSSNPFELAIKYSFIHGPGQSSPAGFEVDAQKEIYGGGDQFGIGVQGDFGVNHFSGFTDKWIVGAAQFYPPMHSGDIHPFGQVGYGESFFGDGDNEGTLKFGGGVRWNLKSPKIVVVVQVNILVWMYGGGHATGFQIASGVVIPLGG